MSEVVTCGAESALLDVTEEQGVPAPQRRRNQRGMISAEWAVGLIAAIAIAGVLVAVVTNGAVKGAILNFILMVISAFTKHLGAA